MSLKILSLEIKDSRINFVKKYNFDEELFVKQSEAVVVLQNILNFVSVATKNMASTLETTAELQVDSDNIKIYKKYSTGEVSYFINDQQQQIDIYNWLSEKLKIKLDPPTWESRLIDFQNLEINTLEDLTKLVKAKDSNLQADSQIFQQRDALNSQFEQLRVESTKGMANDQIQKIDRLRDVKFRINKIQKEVDSYQTQKEDKEKIQSSVKAKEQEFQLLKDKLESVASLMQSRKQIEADMQKFANYGVNENVENLRQQRFNQTTQYLQTAYTKPTHKSITQDEEDNENRNLNLTPKKLLLIVQIPVTLTLIIMGYLLIRQELLLLLGFIVIVLEFAFIIFEFNRKTDQETVSAEENAALFQAEAPQSNALNVPIDNLNDQLFINQAWKSAYIQELNRIDQLISTNLSGRNYSEVQQEKIQKESELNALKQEQERTNANSLDSESYYKKRRELDILKIEKENLEFGSNLQIPNEAQLDSLNQQLIKIEDDIDSIEETKEQMPFVAINVKDSIKSFIKELANKRQIVLISNAK